MKEQMQYCDWCGEELGVYKKYYGDVDTCGKLECQREMRYIIAEAEYNERSEREGY